MGLSRASAKKKKVEQSLTSKGGKGRVSVRSIRVSDFEFIRDTSAHVGGYTIPPLYVLWMLSRNHREVCLIAESSRGQPIGYLLAMTTGLESRGLFIWQFASTFEGTRLRASKSIANRIRRIVVRQRIQRITFTAVPESGATKSIASLARQVLGRRLNAGPWLDKSVSRREREFYISTQRLGSR
jgi:hypothetical protein